jgi:hypothetical protein
MANLGVLGGVVSSSSFEFVITFFEYVGKLNSFNLLVVILLVGIN